MGTTVAGIAATLGVLIALLALLGDKIEAKEFRFVRPPTGFERGGLAIFALVLLGFAVWLAAPDRVSAVLAALSAKPAATVAATTQSSVAPAATTPPASAAKAGAPAAPREADHAAATDVKAAHASAPAASKPAVYHAVWQHVANARDVATYYPERALRAGVDGRVATLCTLNATGAPQACKVIEEDPVGMGFGDAALKVSRLFVAGPKTTDGGPSAGRAVRIDLAFWAKSSASLLTSDAGKAAAPPAGLLTSFACGKSKFNRADDRTWRQYTTGSNFVVWQQAKSGDPSYIVLYDPQQSLYLRAPIKRGPAEVTDAKAEAWKPFCEAIPMAYAAGAF